MSWLDAYFVGYTTIQVGGAPLPQETILNFATGATAVDDPANGRTTVNIEVFIAPTGTGFPHITSGGVDPAARAVNIASSDITGLLPLTNLAYGTAGQFLVTHSGSSGPAEYKSITGDVSASTSTPGQLTVVALQNNEVSSTAPSDGFSLVWSAGSSMWVPTFIGSPSTVTGTGFWFATSGTLNSAAITLTGDISQGGLSSNDIPVTVTGLQNVAVSNTPPTNGYILTYNSGSSSWGPAVNPGVITWADDLAGSSNSGQFVGAITGLGGNGTVTGGTGSQGLDIIMATATTALSTNDLLIEGSAGYFATNTSNRGGEIQIIGGNAHVGSGNAIGGAGGGVGLTGGNGAAGFGTDVTQGGAGGSVGISGGTPGGVNGNGGNATVSASNAVGTGTDGVVTLIAHQAQLVLGAGGIQLTNTTITGITGGTLNLTAAIQQFPLLRLSGTLTSNLNVVFTKEPALWFVDVTALTLGIYTLTFTQGSASTTAITTIGTTTLYIVSCAASNQISINV